MGRARRKTARRRRAWTPTGRTGRRNETPPDERFAETYATLWDPNPGAFLGVVSSFIGFGESTGLSLPPLHLKLADMASEPSDLDNALFVGLSHLAPHADDRVHASSLALAMSDAERARLPAWLGDLGNVSATGATRVISDGCDRHLWLLEVRIAGHSVTAMVGIDDDIGLPAEVAGIATEPLDWLVSVAQHPSTGGALTIDVPPTEAATRILAALDRADELAVAPRVPYWPEPCALLRWMAGIGLRA